MLSREEILHELFLDCLCNAFSPSELIDCLKSVCEKKENNSNVTVVVPCSTEIRDALLAQEYLINDQQSAAAVSWFLNLAAKNKTNRELLAIPEIRDLIVNMAPLYERNDDGDNFVEAIYEITSCESGRKIFATPSVAKMFAQFIINHKVGNNSFICHIALHNILEGNNDAIDMFGTEELLSAFYEHWIKPGDSSSDCCDCIQMFMSRSVLARRLFSNPTHVKGSFERMAEAISTGSFDDATNAAKTLAPILKFRIMEDFDSFVAECIPLALRSQFAAAAFVILVTVMREGDVAVQTKMISRVFQNEFVKLAPLLDSLLSDSPTDRGSSSSDYLYENEREQIRKHSVRETIGKYQRIVAHLDRKLANRRDDKHRRQVGVGVEDLMAQDFGTNDSRLLPMNDENQANHNPDGTCGCCYCGCCCNCWLESVNTLKQFRFEMILFAVTAVVLIVPAYFFYRIINQGFSFHKECVECFAVEHGIGFNQSNHECIFNDNRTNNITLTFNLDEIVVSSLFCGAPQCQAKQLLHGVRPTPYIIMFLSTLFGIFVAILVNFCKNTIWMPLKKRMYQSCGWHLDAKQFELKIKIEVKGDEATDFDVSQDELAIEVFETFELIGMTDPSFFLFLFIAVHAHFIFLVYEVVAGETFPNMSGWKRYETIYALWLQSGTIEVLCFLYMQFPVAVFLIEMAIQDFWEHREVARDLSRFLLERMLFPLSFVANERLEDAHYCSRAVTCIPVVLLPVVFTHVIAAVVIFFPIVILLVIVAFAALRLTATFTQGNYTLTWKVKFGFLAYRVIFCFCVVVFIQTLTNYSIMFYGGMSWPDVIKNEFMNRNSECFANSFLNGIQTANVGLAGLILS